MNLTIPATKARKDFFKLIEKANKPGSSVTVTVDGEAKVVIIPAEDYEGFFETLEIMSDSKMVKDIAEGLAEIRGGKTIKVDELKKRLKI